MATSTTYAKNPLIAVFYSVIFALWLGSQLIDIPYTINVLVLVTSILYVACHRSIELLFHDHDADGDDNDTPRSENKPKINSEGIETLRKEDAMQFPILGSASLFGLYLAFKFFDRDVVNLIISFYFAMVGCAALTMTVSPFFEMVMPIKKRFKKDILINHPLPPFVGGESPWDLSVDASVAEIVSGLGSMVFCYFYFKLKHWAMNNVLGISFCLQGISKFSLGTYKIGAILLVGLFFYDIFWVFGTDVMVTVAKNLDGPIKILFPKSLTPNAESGKIELSLLGLGDIVIPGFFLALLLRFDAHRAGTNRIDAIFPKPYFHSCLISYVVGLATTLFVMIYFNAAQPALLYLVPACLGSSFVCAMVRGEVKQLFDYSEENEEEEEEGGEDKKEEDKKKD